jgi:ubiquinone/menaquinone biosynthesis C-methylase UbiE
MSVERTREHERIRAVYSYYESSDAEQRKRDGANLGNQLNAAARWLVLQRAIARQSLRDGATILDVGCGSGGDLQRIAQEFGHIRPSLYGIDLIPSRIEQARSLLPQAALQVTGGEELKYEDNFFDLVLSSVVFSSILDASVARDIAREMIRVTGKSGTILCYDMRYPNFRNSHVRSIRRRYLQDLFPGSRIAITPVILLPPLARRLGAFTVAAYRPLHGVRLLRSHYLAEIHPD